MFSPKTKSPTRSSASTSSGSAPSSPASDGGATTTDIRSPLDASDDGTEFVPNPGEEPKPRQVGDQYCGSCQHFDYVRTDQGIQPYCGLYDDLMDDMDACDEWTPR
jgi:hypothetical protein